jgi:hypothetical protein
MLAMSSIVGLLRDVFLLVLLLSYSLWQSFGAVACMGTAHVEVLINKTQSPPCALSQDMLSFGEQPGPLTTAQIKRYCKTAR